MNPSAPPKEPTRKKIMNDEESAEKKEMMKVSKYSRINAEADEEKRRAKAYKKL